MPERQIPHLPPRRRIPHLIRVVAFVAVVATTNPSIADSGGMAQSVAFELGSAGTAATGTADLAGSASQGAPDWEDLFDSERRLRDDLPAPSGNGVPDFSDVFGGQWAVILTDNVSLGSAVDTTSLMPGSTLVHRSTVAPDDDIGNAYVYSTLTTSGDLLLYAAAERLADGSATIELEFNQQHIRLGHGPPWQITGARSVGDVLLRLTFTNGVLTSTRVGKWVGGGSVTFQTVAVLSGQGCNTAETVCSVVNAGDIAAGPWGSFDPDGGPSTVGAGRFFEIGLNVTSLTGSTPSLTTIRVRTLTDIAFGYFAEGN